MCSKKENCKVIGDNQIAEVAEVFQVNNDVKIINNTLFGEDTLHFFEIFRSKIARIYVISMMGVTFTLGNGYEIENYLSNT